MMEIEVKVLKLKAKEHLGPQKVEEASKDHPLEASFRGSTALPTSEFRTSSLQNTLRLFKPPSLWFFAMAALAN